MAVGFSNTNKPINPRGNDASPKAFNRAKLYSGKALDFDGVNDSIDISNFSLNGYTAFSVCFYKMSDFNNGMIFSSADSISDGVNIYQISPGYFRARLNGVNAVDTTLKVSEKEGFFVFTYDGTNAKWYYQAQNIDSGTTSQTFAIANTTSTIGRQSYASTQYLSGDIAGFKIFNTALTAAQVADLYNNPEKVVPTGVANTALKLWLPMQEGAGTTAYDGSGNGNHGTISGATYTHGIGAPVSQTSVIDWNKGTNYLAYSENMVTGWTLQNLAASQNATTAPDGRTTAIKFTASAANTFHLDNYTRSAGAGIWKQSVFAKAGEVDFVFLVIRVNGGTDRYGVKFDLTDGTFVDDITSGSPTNTGYEITDAGNGWYKCTIQASHTSGNITAVYGPNIAGNLVDVNGSHLGDGVSGMYMWGASLRPSTDSDSYVRTEASRQTTPVLLPQGLTTGRDITGVNLFENVRKQGALNLDGNSWALVHDNLSNDIEDEVTLECWYYHVETTAINHLIGKRASSGGWLRIYSASSNTIKLERNGGSGSSNVYITENAWNHIVATIDDSDNMKIYINGTQQASAASFTPWSMDNSAPVSIAAWATSMTAIPAVNSRTTGSIAQPRIYNRALTAAEVLQNYNSGKNTYK